MKQLNLSDWKELNNSFPRRLIYHVGIDCGFSVELNYMINAMLYCLAKGYRFQFYSEDANFGTGTGWTEYFAPFCEEVHETFHHKYNLHRPPTWRHIMRNVIKTRSLSFFFWKLKFMLKSLIGHWLAYKAYGEYVRLSQDVAHDPDNHYHIPALGLNCAYTEAYAMLAVNDVFASMRQKITIFSDIHQFYLDKRTDNRSLKLTIRYNFNPARSKYRGTGAGNDVKGRL